MLTGGNDWNNGLLQRSFLYIQSQNASSFFFACSQYCQNNLYKWTSLLQIVCTSLNYTAAAGSIRSLLWEKLLIGVPTNQTKEPLFPVRGFLEMSETTPQWSHTYPDALNEFSLLALSGIISHINKAESKLIFVPWPKNSSSNYPSGWFSLGSQRSGHFVCLGNPLSATWSVAHTVQLRWEEPMGWDFSLQIRLSQVLGAS